VLIRLPGWPLPCLSSPSLAYNVYVVDYVARFSRLCKRDYVLRTLPHEVHGAQRLSGRKLTAYLNSYIDPGAGYVKRTWVLYVRTYVRICSSMMKVVPALKRHAFPLCCAYAAFWSAVCFPCFLFGWLVGRPFMGVVSFLPRFPILLLCSVAYRAVGAPKGLAANHFCGHLSILLSLTLYNSGAPLHATRFSIDRSSVRISAVTGKVTA